jgi:phosphohistidine phosphatase
MKTLLLLRHAKSDWGDRDRDDFDRTLNARGCSTAPKMAQYIDTQNLTPDLVWCSTAQRARQTWSLVGSALTHDDQDIEVAFRDDLYLAPSDRLLDLIKTASDATLRLMIVAHNPVLHDLAISLTKTARVPEDLTQLEAGLPTAALVVLEFEVGRWAAIDRGVLERFVRPKTL